VSSCVLDTDVLIAALDRSDSHYHAAAKSFQAMIEQGVTLLLSPINYAETLVKPAEDEQTLRIAIDAISALGVRLIAPTPAIARDAARCRSLGVSLADGFAIATAQAQNSTLATFDRRVRRALPRAGLELSPLLG